MISPGLPEQFGSQDNLLSMASLEAFGNFTQEEEEEEEEEEDDEADGVASIKVEENLLFERQQKLKKLLDMSGPDTSQLVSSLGFPSSSHDSPASPAKTDLFNFSPHNFDATSSIEDTHPSAPIIDKHTSRHLIFAAYFPLEAGGTSQQELNERSVVLCGTGKARKTVDEIVGEIRSDVEHHFRLLERISSPILPDLKLPGLLEKFRMLPVFYQNQIASGCAQDLLTSLSPSIPYPSCTQLVFVCQLFSVAGSVQQILDLLVDIVACGGMERRDGMGEKRQSFSRLPNELCIPVVNLIWYYIPSLLLSQHDTSVVFEWSAMILHTCTSAS